VATNVLGAGAVFLLGAALAYALTRSGIRLPSSVQFSVPDEVLLGLAVLVVSLLAVVCGGVAAALGRFGVQGGVQWASALGVTLLVAVPTVRRTWAATARQVDLVQAKRDARAGLPAPSTQTRPGRHER
jgi:hypothetical protein